MSYTLAAIGIAFGIFMLYLVFVHMPVQMYTEIQCLRQGYPKYSVAANLEAYCMNLEGTITIKVKPQ